MLSMMAASTRLSTLLIQLELYLYHIQGVFPTLQHIGGMPALRNLRALTFDIHPGTCATHVHIRMRFSDIASPFSTISSLEHVSFNVTYRVIDLSHQDLTWMQEVWPRLKTLAVVYDISDLHQRRLVSQVEEPHESSLASVVAFTKKLDQLEVLDIDIANASAEDVDQLCALVPEESAVGRESPPQSQTALRHLTFAMNS